MSTMTIARFVRAFAVIIATAFALPALVACTSTPKNDEHLATTESYISGGAIDNPAGAEDAAWHNSAVALHPIDVSGGVFAAERSSPVVLFSRLRIAFIAQTSPATST